MVLFYYSIDRICLVHAYYDFENISIATEMFDCRMHVIISISGYMVHIMSYYYQNEE